jgi:hypothetical protein
VVFASQHGLVTQLAPELAQRSAPPKLNVHVEESGPLFAGVWQL